MPCPLSRVCARAQVEPYPHADPACQLIVAPRARSHLPLALPSTRVAPLYPVDSPLAPLALTFILVAPSLVCVQLPKDKLNYKPRTSVKDLAELERLLRDQV